MPTITITSEKPVVVMDAEEYQAMRETIEILSDPALVRDIRRARREFKEGKTIPLEKVMKEHNED